MLQQTPSLEQKQAATLRETRVMEECKLKAVTPAKKLVQARLPFKRLNPVPKPENEQTTDTKRTKISTNAPEQLAAVKLIASVEDVENDCKINLDGQTGNSATVDGDLAPCKLVNGKGPLDDFLHSVEKKNAVVTMHTSGLHSTIDLTCDSSNEGLDSIGTTDVKLLACEKELNEKTTVVSEKKCNWFDSLKPSESKEVNSENSASGQSSRESKTYQGQEIESNSPIVNNALRGRMPVVVLKDIMAGKACWTGSLEKGIMQVGGSGSFTNESSESPISSLSSSISATDSSPETKSPADERSPRSAFSTPGNKVTQTPKLQGKRLKQQQEREEKRLKLKIEKEERERAREEARLAKERAKEEAKRKKDEEKEQKDKERKEKKEKEEKEKAERLRLKEEKRKEKQDALEAKLEEKKKKEEEKRLKEEEKRLKAEKVKEISEITRFFQKPKAPQAPKTLAGSCGKFAPFEIKEHMVLAPTSRIYLDQEDLEQLDELLERQSYNSNYIKELHNQKPRTSGPTSPKISITDTNLCSDDVIMIDTNLSSGIIERRKLCRMKLLQFCENHRPAYWGTWQKKSMKVNPRNPLAKDEQLLDYEVDSDDEWEEEEPGESLSHSEGDDDDEADDEDDDDGFFVPHGYLSEGEGATDEEGENPEKQKIRQRMKAKEWDELMKGKKFQVLQPTLIGCFWESDNNVLQSSAMKILQQFSVCLFENQMEDEQIQEIHNGKLKEEQILISLLPLLHGNVNGRKAIIKEFQEWYKQKPSAHMLAIAASDSSSPLGSDASRPQTPTVDDDLTIPSKAKLQRLISENGVYEKRTAFRLKCWYVHEEVLKKFRMENLPVPGQWQYLTQVQSAVKEESTIPAASGQSVPCLGRNTGQCVTGSSKRKTAGSMSIKQFMHKFVDADGQAEVMETDGFQADTEEDDDADCVIVEVHTNNPAPNKEENKEQAADLCAGLVKSEEMPNKSGSELVSSEANPVMLCCGLAAGDAQSTEPNSDLTTEEMMDIEPCENAAVKLPNRL
ncbi:chromatin assembly factor 1 subunit A isoform X1 [Chiloscyllium plagiosum]|uniref:chromatin assembly factor 1 subunit A isoform X1 n=2 Tax=Chiloscyllium plagiosum TaxID=36176 RepID=UPI001CB7F240|nr:chromatin assembly factor 1 subunit A isoform X1 [Chiloscyllium plagiosum]